MNSDVPEEEPQTGPLAGCQDGSSADLLIPAEANPEETTYEWCLHLLHEASIVVTSAVSGRMRGPGRVRAGVEIRECIATGTPVQHGVDGHIEWYEGFAPASPRRRLPARQRARAGRERASRCVSTAGLLSSWSKRVSGSVGSCRRPKGADGADAHGQVVAARPGKAVKVRAKTASVSAMTER